ncbi:FAD/NAD(P)-binding domain-containing protein [Xylaria venustula]|nr:FAD/NAD(P)-binding domain-containing protein [Xylaria venustula]
MDDLISSTLDRVARLCEADYYDYIVIGSGMGGGILARTLVEHPEKPRVLIIERGGLLLHTHCMNLATPRWNYGSLTGPSQNNDYVYSKLKDSFMTVTAKSETYAGGPVYGLGGRSTVWGLFSPKIDEDQLQVFPPAVRDYLRGDGYEKAYKLMTNDAKASHDRPYPEDFNGIDTNVHDEIIKTLNQIQNFDGQNLCFRRSPMAVEFTARDPGSKLYHILQGGYSTVPWILDQVLNNSEHLNLLAQTRVITVNKANLNQSRIESLTVHNQHGKERTFSVGNATVILSAGTIDTAAIALRSGVEKDNPLVGRGLTDHDIWGTRFMFQARADVDQLMGQALKLQTTTKLHKTPYPIPLENQEAKLPSTQETVVSEYQESNTSGNPETSSLLTVTVNASSFLGYSTERAFSCQYIDSRMHVVQQSVFFEDDKKTTTEPTTVQVVFLLPATLKEENRVLNRPDSIPSIQFTKEDTSIYATHMQILAERIRDKLAGQVIRTAPVPQLSRSPFGVVAHEVGTMRMGVNPGERVVDDNLRVHNFQNLFVCDLSVLPISPSSNPSLTLAALAQRLGHHLETRRKNE